MDRKIRDAMTIRFLKARGRAGLMSHHPAAPSVYRRDRESGPSGRFGILEKITIYRGPEMVSSLDIVSVALGSGRNAGMV